MGTDVVTNANRIVPEVLRMEYIQEAYRFANLSAIDVATPSQTWNILPTDNDIDATLANVIDLCSASVLRSKSPSTA